ncbi:MAG: lysophospholipid acyltransferase family protein [Balneolaceae bacterium]
MKNSLSFTEYMRSLCAISVFYLLMLVVSILIFLAAILSFGKATNWSVKTFAPILGRPVLYILGIDFEVKDMRSDPSQPVVYIFNHSSTLDIPALLSLALKRIRIVVKWELQYIPFLFIIGRLTGQVFIKRHDKEHSIATLQKALNRIKDNNLNLVLAPEGTRKHKGIIGPFKKGAFHMALQLGYPIVPIYFDGNGALSHKGSIMARSGKIVATIHPPVETSSWDVETIDEHIADVREMYLGWANIK